MPVFKKFQEFIGNRFFSPKEIDPESAYDLWSQQYDNQPDNLMLALDDEIFFGLINNISLTDKIILDVGCGTGRHWKKILEREPQEIIGYDVSEGMLKVLREKFPKAQTHHLGDEYLRDLRNNYCDIIISTLTVAHIENIEESVEEWFRVLRPGGDIIITDYHPDALVKGGKRTFTHNKKVIAVKNYIHSIKKFKEIANKLQLQVAGFTEKHIDESVRHYYEKADALSIYNRFKGVPIIYGIHLKKSDAVN